MNNFEHLKAMSMEEMAEIMRNGCDERECLGIPFPADTPFAKDASNEQCRQCWLEWLKRDAELNHC